MRIEQKINYYLNKTPKLKKRVKRLYQRAMYAVSPKVKSEGEIIRISPDDPRHEYFFGYYDKCPWDANDRYMICMRAKDTWSQPSPQQEADILLIDTHKDEKNPHRVTKIAKSSTWNVQQGCMAQWLGPDCKSRIIYNDCRNGKYVSVVLELASKKEQVIPAPVYTVSSDGKTALTLDFSRLYNLRPGYGYCNIPEKTRGIALPEATAVWKIDIESQKVMPLLSYRDFAQFKPRSEMREKNAVHKVNHLMFCPDGKRFMVLYRWFCGSRKYSRLITCNTDGSDMFLLSDDDMVSHCYWKNNHTVLAFENKRGSGAGYYLMRDKTDQYIRCWPQLDSDGHPGYSPDGSTIVTDTYPDRFRMASIKLMDGNRERNRNVITIGRVSAPFKYDNDTRCDLHPRWNRAGDMVCFDSVFEGHRGLYAIDVSDQVKEMHAHVKEGRKSSEFDMGQVRFIMPLHGFYNSLIQKSGYDIRNPYAGNAMIPRIFRELHFRLHLPFQEIWNNRENITDKKYIIVYEPLITRAYMKWLHKMNPQSRIYLSYINKVNRANNPDKFRFSWCSLWTSDPDDAEKYNLNLYEGISAFRSFKVNKKEPEYDVFYAGKDKGRKRQIDNVRRQFQKAGLKTYFHIVPGRRIYKWLSFGRQYSEMMPYEVVLEYIGKSRAILHLLSGGQKGITMRIIESLVYEVKLITDYAEIKDYDFYNPNNIFILGVDKIKDLPEFLDKPYVKVKSKFFERLYFEDGVKYMVTKR